MPDPVAIAKMEKKGVRFSMRGGPLNGNLLRLYPGPYLGMDKDERVGWEYVPVEGGRYVRPDDSDPYMKAPAKVNKKHTNVPYMTWESQTIPT